MKCIFLTMDNILSCHGIYTYIVAGFVYTYFPWLVKKDEKKKVNTSSYHAVVSGSWKVLWKAYHGLALGET